MTTTTNLGLTIYDTASGSSVTFQQYRLATNGLSSNMTIIDAYAGYVTASVVVLKTSSLTTIIANQITTNYYEATSGAITNYFTNMSINLKVNVTNSGSTTMNINAYGVKPVKKVNSSGSIVQLSASDLIANQYYLCVYDGTQFVMAAGGISASSSGSSGSTVYSGSSPITVAGSVISLSVSGVSPGSYTSANITVNANGIITSASNGISGSSSGAPSDNPFITSGSSSSLSNYRQLTAGSNISIVSASTNGGTIIIHSTSSGGGSDWNAAGQTWTFNSADSPTYRFTTGGVDVSGIYSPGMKFRMTHNSSTKYFVCTAVTGSLVTCYGGTDYVLSGSAITSPYFSTSKSPFGFPLDPSKWSVIISSSANVSQSSPANLTWYNLGSSSISIPIGIWDVSYALNGFVGAGAASILSFFSTLSTTNNSESDPDFTAYIIDDNATQFGTRIYVKKTLGVSSKTTYYLNSQTDQDPPTEIDFMGGLSPTIIKAACSYL